MDLDLIKLKVTRYNKRCEMLADLYAVLRLIDDAQMHGAHSGTATHDQWKRLQDAKQIVCGVLEEVKIETAKYRQENS